jgi:hypothetical protein
MSSELGQGASRHRPNGFAIASAVFGGIALVETVLFLVAFFWWDFTTNQYMSEGSAFLFWITAIFAIPLGSLLAIIFGFSGLHRPDGHRDPLAVAGATIGASVAVCVIVILAGGFLNG